MNFSSTYSEALDKITKNCFKSKKAFVLFKKATEHSLHLIISDTYAKCSLDDITEQSFVFMPFNKQELGYSLDATHQIKDDQIIALSSLYTDIESTAFSYAQEQEQLDEDAFINYVDSIKKNIKNGSFNKLVASRISSKRFKGNMVSAYLNLCDLYNHSFNYLVYIPNEQCWIGATPETLLKIDHQELSTISLAGTQVKNDQNSYSWGAKERKEQEIVTQFIKESIETLAVTNAQITEPYTVEAGNLVHLRTDLKYTFSESVHPKDIIHLLHPTPAVCGMPKAVCERYILRNEPHERAFYTGYLGLYTNKNDIELYVNLRCASIDNNFIHFYIGCGITADSIAENEWIETENKLQTLKTAFRL